jgi:hypothetical protein
MLRVSSALWSEESGLAARSTGSSKNGIFHRMGIQMQDLNEISVRGVSRKSYTTLPRDASGLVEFFVPGYHLR